MDEDALLFGELELEDGDDPRLFGDAAAAVAAAAAVVAEEEDDDEEEEEEEEAEDEEECGDNDGGDVPGDEDEWVCPICMRSPSETQSDVPTEAVDVCAVKGCQHQFCISCIVTWAELRDPQPPSCPTCKQDFTHLYVNRTADGVPTGEYFREEAVSVLRSATWIRKDALALKGKKPATWVGEEDAMRGTWYDDDDEEDYDDYDGAEFADHMSHRNRQALRRMGGGTSNTPSRVFGNRRFGAGGFVANGGRSFARPRPAPPPPRASPPTPTPSVPVPSKGKGKAAQHAASSPCPTGASPSTPGSCPKVSAAKAKRDAKKEAKLQKEAEKAERRRKRLSGGGGKDEVEGKKSAAEEPESASLEELAV